MEALADAQTLAEGETRTYTIYIPSGKTIHDALMVFGFEGFIALARDTSKNIVEVTRPVPRKPW